MIKLTHVLMLSFLFAQTVTAAPYSTDDFAYKASLSNAETSLRVIDLPVDVYKKMQRNDYGDLRIFNANGQIVPHQFSHPRRENITQQTALAFYPFSKKQAQNPSNIQVIINQKQGEQSLKINQQLGTKNTSKSAQYQYIIKNAEKDLSLCKLQLSWKQNKASMILPFKLEASDALQHWQTLSRKLVVSRLNYGGSLLTEDTVNFSCTTKKYLRLTWLNAKQKTSLQKIQAIYSKNKTQQKQWSRFGKPRYDEDGNWLFESNMVAPITQIEFIAPQDGLLYKGMLYSRNNKEQRWNFHKEINQYQLNMGETTLKSSPVGISANADRYWKLSVVSEGKFSDKQLPEIRGAWTPAQLHFLAQGEGPFQLAFGNPSIKPAYNNDLDSLIESLKDAGSNINKVSLTEIINNNKSFTEETKTPWKLIILWLVLIAGTALMGFMAFRLYRQMNNAK